MIDTTYLTDALASLPAHKRHIFKAVLCEQRDRSVVAGNHDQALVWNALAVTIAELEDHERLTLRRLEEQWSPIVREMTPEELAEVHFDDEIPTEPPC